MNIANDTISIETIIHAGIPDVWKAWTDSALILKWFGSDPNGKGLGATLDVRPYGNYEINFMNSDLSEHSCTGIYIEIKQFSKLSFSWEWKSEPGVISFVSVELVPDGSFTLMRFEHVKVGHNSMHDYSDGWQGAFLKLERLLNPTN